MTFFVHFSLRNLTGYNTETSNPFSVEFTINGVVIITTNESWQKNKAYRKRQFWDNKKRHVSKISKCNQLNKMNFQGEYGQRIGNMFDIEKGIDCNSR